MASIWQQVTVDILAHNYVSTNQGQITSSMIFLTSPGKDSRAMVVIQVALSLSLV